VSADLAAERRRERGEAAQLYEQNETQRALVLFYKELARHMPQDRVVLVDGVGSIDEVHERVFQAYAAERARMLAGS
jgi:dTMP kinase